MMINKRLVGTVSESKKYVAGNVASILMGRNNGYGSPVKIGGVELPGISETT